MRVSVVTLNNGSRPEMLARAIACVGASTYQEIEHIVFDSSPYKGRTIGYIRNIANACATGELIAHADDDDTFHPDRLAEQVALMEFTGKQCVGYRELLFWDTRMASIWDEAWHYRYDDPRYAVGASLLYRRDLWERQPFDDAPHEDRRWLATSAVSATSWGVSAMSAEPRMVCGIHGSNTEAYDRAVMRRDFACWRRAPEWDKYCAERMVL